MYDITGSMPNQPGMFTFYIEGQPTDHTYPLFLRGDNEVVLGILSGVTINTAHNSINFEPLYKPLFIFDKRPGALRVEFLGARLTLSRRWPPIYLERVNPKGDLE